MTFSLKDIIFDFFGIKDKLNDLFKDVNGKGLHQRFNEMLAEDLDENEIDKTNNVVKYTCDPQECMEKFLFYKEQAFGGLYAISSNPIIRRKILSFAVYLNRIKGTEESYQIPILLLGFTTVEIHEFDATNGFDSPTTFDDEERVFDMKCAGCGKYRINITGTISMTAGLLNSIINIVKYNEPINAKLENIYYNGSPAVVDDSGGDFDENDFDENDFNV